ncbi:bifunctional demethylmenaquinone methyltransferase/2-methoxy-6-polyprenyl-1,4-benzoquinol methylase UbiE [Micavibrio aeruginosavorus]|uniref:Demethylmenaquinone methyltransferase n=1 Tax=Micavibrio aeruginosavorus EPB TaxID=349215 RepID=M4VWX0_9BACT|nr:bifunctional demethylmenaquinone methyltransferase/2-methoxy-6-polyprenyl-1,4-benzoquinol methylase UbiE [Micavibrio aeruginosavorus]AGH97699.1 Ubiquinone/menaquinone biosynthesis methyltransferase UbiE [Micavibrio aeruginosavorus EPB]
MTKAQPKPQNEKNPEREWFGERHVSPEEKTGLVHDVFASVADSYDVMNDFMSAGVHRLWKDRLVRMIRPRSDQVFLDVAGGTGDIAFRIRAKAGPNTAITVCDINPEMLRVGRDRAINRGWMDDFEWVTGNAECLPIPDASVDVYTIAFGLRNVTHIDRALADAYRVLKPGGRFYCMEFSRVTEPMLRRIYDAYSYSVIPKIGEIVAKDRDSYQYLVESIRKFPPQRELEARMRAAGFDRARHTNLSFGIAAIHEGWKY